MSGETENSLKELVELTAHIRQVGKKARNLTRKVGNIPAVIYGKNLQKPLLIDISKKEFTTQIKDFAFNTRIKLKVKNTNEEYDVLVKAIDHDIIKSDIIHVDFIHINDKDQLLICRVPLKFINEVLSPGLKRGGVLNVIHRKLYVKCNKDDMPKHLTVDLTGFEGSSIITAKRVILPNTSCKLLITSEKQAIASIIGGKASAVVQESTSASGKKQARKKK